MGGGWDEGGDVGGGWDEGGDVGGGWDEGGDVGGGGSNGQGGDGDLKINDTDDDQWDADGECDDLVGKYNKYNDDKGVTDGSVDDLNPNNSNVDVNDFKDGNVGNGSCEVKRRGKEGIYIDSHSETNSDKDIVGEEVHANRNENKSSNCVYEEISGIQGNDLKTEEAQTYL